MSKQLFSIPVHATNGSFTCTIPFPAPENRTTYLLTFTSPPDNRLIPEFLDSFVLALDVLEQNYPKGVLITTSGIEKFFSNGLDLQKALSVPNFFEKHLYPLFRRLLTYHMPTIALVNGHAFAGGFMLAMYHDYRIQNPHRGYLCLNEIALGIPLSPPMRSIFMNKIQDGAVIRSTVLEGKRFNAKEALQSKIVDGMGGLPEAIEFVSNSILHQIVSSPSYVPLKERLWAGVLDSIDNIQKWEAADEERAKGSVDAVEKGKDAVKNAKL